MAAAATASIDIVVEPGHHQPSAASHQWWAVQQALMGR